MNNVRNDMKRKCIFISYEEFLKKLEEIFGEGTTVTYKYGVITISTPDSNCERNLYDLEICKKISKYFDIEITNCIVDDGIWLFYKDEDWTICLSEVRNNTVIVTNGPEKSGQYLCTCVFATYAMGMQAVGQATQKYLQMMEWDAEKQYWHDIGRSHACSHVVLAYRKIEPSDFTAYKYNAGNYLTATE